MRPEDHIQSTLKAHRVLWATTFLYNQKETRMLTIFLLFKTGCLLLFKHYSAYFRKSGFQLHARKNTYYELRNMS